MNRLRARAKEVVDDPATGELLEPWYRYGCKRSTFSDDYLQVFNRPDVTLVDTVDVPDRWHGLRRVVERVPGHRHPQP